MLITFRATNFRAYRDTQELSLRRARGLRSDAQRADWDRSLSPVAAVYGANASGKSTLYAALEFLHRAVRDSFTRWSVGGSTRVVPFRLDERSRDEPTELEVEFRADDNVDYVYGFRASKRRIESEWLFAYRTASRSIIFEREGAHVDYGNSFRGTRSAIDEALVKRENALVLSIAAQLGNETVSAAFNWITDKLRTYDARDHRAEHLHIMDALEQDPSLAPRLADVLSRADLGIRDLTVVRRERSEKDVEQIVNIVKGLSANQDDLSDDDYSRITQMASRTLQLTHASAGAPVAFPMSWESDGTKALLSFASIALKALQSGATVVVDEIDSSLHPLLVSELISLFGSADTNPLQAQLIVTTHDVTLLTASDGEEPLLARDQIWLTEKGGDGASSLVALSEYRTPRKSENLARGYLTGRYGGVPLLTIFAGIAHPDDPPLPTVERSVPHG